MKTSDGLLLAGGAILAYYVYKKINEAGTAVNSAANSVASGIAGAIVGTSTVTPQGSVIMPDGSSFPTSELTNMEFGFDGPAATFLGNDGNTYQLSSQVNGSYTASLY